MKETCSGVGAGADGKKPPDDDKDGHHYPPPPSTDDGPEEDITFRDGVVEVNITSDFEGEITMNEATRKAAEELKAAADAFLADASKSDELREAMNRMGSTEAMGGSTSGQDAPKPTAPSGGGDRPPFVTVNVNVTQHGD